MRRIHDVLLIVACSGAALVATVPAQAEDAAVAQRLTQNGGLSAAGAKRLITKVTQRMAKSADTLASANDPLRIAMSQALFHTPTPPDNMAAAKMRLKLYAGLNEAALDSLFAPKAGAVASCVRAVGATQMECEALVAAAGRISVAQARGAAGGPAVAVAVVAAPARPAAAPAPAGGSRFGHYSSGFGGASAAPAPAYAVAPAPAPRAQPTQFRPAPAAAPVAVAPTQSAVSRKEAYRLQREAYLARQKAEFEERKQKLEGAGAPAAAPASAASPAPAVASAKAAPVAAPAKAAPAKAAAVAAAEEPVAAEEPAEVAASSKPALEAGFLDGLLADPLGKN